MHMSKDAMAAPRLRRGFADEIIKYHIIPWAEMRKNYFSAMVQVNKAHVVMLKEQGIISRSDAARILEGIGSIEALGVQNFPFDYTLGDLYMNMESFLIGKIGEEIGGKIHTGRSRNDLFAATLHLALSQRVLELLELILDFKIALMNLADSNVETLLPGYTHTQHAQPLTFAHYLLAVLDMTIRDFHRLENGYHRIDVNPLGGVALAGTSFPLNRQRTTELLGFEGILENSLDAISARDDVAEVMACLAILGSNLSRFSNDLVVWSSMEFAMVELADEFCTSSSIMPQKKNPWAPEMTRALAGELIGDSVKCLTILKNLPMGFSWDLMVFEHAVWNSMEIARDMLMILKGVIATLKVNNERMRQLAPEGFSTVTELADQIVLKTNLSFRTAHRIVGILVRNSVEKGLTARDITAEMLDRSAKEVVGRPLGIGQSEIDKALDAKRNVDLRTTMGGPAPKEVRRMLQTRRLQLEKERGFLKNERMRLEESKKKLDEAVAALVGFE